MSDNLDDRLRRLQEDLGLGPTGDYPRGKLTPQDEGGLKIACGVEQGKVILHFGKAVVWLGLEPQDARALAASLLKQADRAEGRGAGG
jgi:hypothetical protein